MKCSDLHEYLLDYALGEPLSGETGGKVKEHLSACPRCRVELEAIRQAWQSLAPLERVRFPSHLSRSVLQELRRQIKPPLFSHLWWVSTPPVAYLRLAAVAVLLILGSIFLFRHAPWLQKEKIISPDYETLRFSPTQASLPDLQETLENYLSQSSSILDELDKGNYDSWKEVFRDIFTADVQGKANYLLENLRSDSTALPLVRRLHDTFWQILQTGRWREEETVHLPPEINLSRLLQEIRNYQEKSGD